MPLQDDRVWRSLQSGSNVPHQERKTTVGVRLVTTKAPNHPAHYHVCQIHDYGHHHVGCAFSKTDVVMAYHQNPDQPTYKKYYHQTIRAIRASIQILLITECRRSNHWRTSYETSTSASCTWTTWVSSVTPETRMFERKLFRKIQTSAITGVTISVTIFPAKVHEHLAFHNLTHAAATYTSLRILDGIRAKGSHTSAGNNSFGWRSISARRQLLTISEAVKHFSHVLKTSHSIIFTNHKPKIFVFKQKKDKCSPWQIYHWITSPSSRWIFTTYLAEIMCSLRAPRRGHHSINNARYACSIPGRLNNLWTFVQRNSAPRLEEISFPAPESSSTVTHLAETLGCKSRHHCDVRHSNTERRQETVSPVTARGSHDTRSPTRQLHIVSSPPAVHLYRPHWALTAFSKIDVLPESIRMFHALGGSKRHDKQGTCYML